MSVLHSLFYCILLLCYSSFSWAVTCNVQFFCPLMMCPAQYLTHNRCLINMLHFSYIFCFSTTFTQVFPFPSGLLKWFFSHYFLCIIWVDVVHNSGLHHICIKGPVITFQNKYVRPTAWKSYSNP